LKLHLLTEKENGNQNLDLKQKQKSVIADKTYSMYSDFSLLQVTLPEVHHMVSPGKKWG